MFLSLTNYEPSKLLVNGITMTKVDKTRKTYKIVTFAGGRRVSEMFMRLLN